MTQQIKGVFDVKRSMEPACDMGDGVDAGHFRYDKRFHGDLDATSVVHMLAVMTAVEGSAGYVAIERVTGKVLGREGSFFLQHSGIMDRGAPTLALLVVPDSGTKQLEGISGGMQIDIVDGTHFYTFDFDLV